MKMQYCNFMFVLYGCETEFLAARKKNRLRESKNNMQRTIFRPKRQEAIGGWKKLLGLSESFVICTLLPSLLQ
jgi:ribose 1,5-bisphosphokinase PhnN